MPRWNPIAPVEQIKSHLALHAVTASKATCYGLRDFRMTDSSQEVKGI